VSATLISSALLLLSLRIAGTVPPQPPMPLRRRVGHRLFNSDFTFSKNLLLTVQRTCQLGLSDTNLLLTVQRTCQLVLSDTNLLLTVQRTCQLGLSDTNCNIHIVTMFAVCCSNEPY
jgi:hypothetical protein